MYLHNRHIDTCGSNIFYTMIPSVAKTYRASMPQCHQNSLPADIDTA